MCDFLTLHPYYIYPHYPQKYKRLFKEKNPRQVFYNTIHPYFRRESYSSLVRNHCSQFSFPFPLSYLERRFVFKYNAHIFKVQIVIWSLGSFGDLPKEAGKAWRMQSDVLQDSKSQRRHDSEKSVGSRSLRVQVHWVDQAQRVFCYSCTPTLFSSGSISTWRVVERFFTEFFGFFFNNTSRYLVFVSLFCYSCTLLLLFIVHVHVLELILVPFLNKLE